jgi:FkbM family methyltransferase
MFVDCGGNIGSMSLHAASLGRQVVAFEPGLPIGDISLPVSCRMDGRTKLQYIHLVLGLRQEISTYSLIHTTASSNLMASWYLAQMISNPPTVEKGKLAY